MGIYDRDYYRNEGPSFLGSWGDQGKACTWLIAITVGVFVLQLLSRSYAPMDGFPFGPRMLREPITDALKLDVTAVWRGEVWRLVTYAFLHSTSGFWHILFNMLFLWWFGREVEARIGTAEFVTFYLVTSLAGALVYMATAAAGLHGLHPVVGASGAVLGVLMLSALYNPSQVIYLFFVLPVPIWFVILFLLASDAFALFARQNTGVASAVHLAGLAFGFAYDRLGMRLTAWFPFWAGGRYRPTLRIYTEEEEPPLPAKRTSALHDEHLEAKVDAILEKVGRVGMAGLTDQEREVLQKASDAIRRKEG